MATRGRPKGAKNKIRGGEIFAPVETTEKPAGGTYGNLALALGMPDLEPAPPPEPTIGDLLGLAPACPIDDAKAFEAGELDKAFPIPVPLEEGNGKEEPGAEDDELEIRQKAIDMGIMVEATAAIFPLDELKKMIADAQEAGLPPDKNDKTGAAVVMARGATQIVRELLGMIAVRNANGMAMTNICIKCEQQPEHLKEVCVCRSARRFLEMADAGG